MRWLVLGAGGMLGADLTALLAERGIEVTAPGRAQVDLLDGGVLADVVAGHDVVVNCAAWTAVDDAESHEAEAFAVNATAPQHLAAAVARLGGRLVHISTDYVFDGTARSPYDEDTSLGPRSAYGRTKAAGEWAVRALAAERGLVVRTAWLYGAHGDCFPKTIARLAADRGRVSVVDDQVGQPTWTADVARVVVDLVLAEAPAGVYHATSTGSTSWCGFAREVVRAAGLDASVVTPTTTDAFPRPAPRPSYSVLGHRRLHEAGIDVIGDWRERWAQAAPSVLG